MANKRLQRAIGLTAVLALGLIIGACGKIAQDTSGGSLGGGTVDELYVSLNLPTDNGGSEVMIVTSEFTDPSGDGIVVTKKGCAVNPSDTNKDIYCIVHLPEFDLYHQGVDMTFNIPKSMCDYGVRQSSWFYNREPGVGPDYISFTVTDGGAPSAIVIKDGGVGGTASTNAEVKADGTALCNFDHTKAAGVNCCVGEYTLVKTTVDTAAGSSTTTTSVVDWGGDYGNCVGGHAADDESPRANLKYYGVPTPVTFPVKGDNVEHDYKVKPIIERAISYSAQAANYFYTSTPTVPASWPLAFRVPANGPASSGLVGVPYVQLQCHDRHKDLQARIRLMIQDWSTKTEFDKFLLGQTADPNVAGVETDWPNYPDFDFFDLWDWTKYPSVYPEMPLEVVAD